MTPQPAHTHTAATWDVVVVGGGIAALGLSRLLHLEAPGTRVLTLDKALKPTRKVGESTVEIAGQFLVSRLRLGEVLKRVAYPKNGIRFWFDDPEHTAGWAEASEDGPATFAWWQTWQVEREPLELELEELCRAAGSTHLRGVKEVEIEEAPEVGGLHTVRWTLDGQRHEARARWLVDASGHGGTHARTAGVLRTETRLEHNGSAWAWFSGARQPHEIMGPAARKRPCFGRRLLSTNSLMGEGYWVWMIPLQSGLLSVGVVYDKSVVKDAPRTLEELRAFLDRHAIMREALGGAEAHDFQRLDHFALKATRNIDPRRMAWIGTAGGFVDPLYSSGIDFIALECDYLVDLIKRERAGERMEDMGPRLRAYNRFIELYHEQTVMNFAGLYKTFVSQELVLPRYRRDVGQYWLLYAWPYFSRQHLDLEFLAAHEQVASEVTRRHQTFNRILLHAYEQLKARGKLHRMNKGVYTWNQLGYRTTPMIRFERQLGRPLDAKRARDLARELDAVTFLALLDVLFDSDRSPVRGLLYDTVVGAPMDAIIARAEASPGALDEAFWAEVWRILDASFHERLAARGLRLPGLGLSPATWRRLTQEVAARAPDPETARAAHAYLMEVPRQDDLDDLPPIRTEVQEFLEWGRVSGPGWNVGLITGKTVYDMLGGSWWKERKDELPGIVWGLKAAEAEAELNALE